MKPATIDQLRAAVMPLMDGFSQPWCVAGGWALDLFLGQVTRPHEDLELALFRQDQGSLRRHLSNWMFQKTMQERLVDWPADEELKPPIHEIHARTIQEPRVSLEFLLNERTGDEWVYRRDARIRMPLASAIVHDRGRLPLLCPAIVLLFKAKNHRPKDDADFQHVRNAMSAQQRRWLAASLRLCHPTHSWLLDTGKRVAK